MSLMLAGLGPRGITSAYADLFSSIRRAIVTKMPVRYWRNNPYIPGNDPLILHNATKEVFFPKLCSVPSERA